MTAPLAEYALLLAAAFGAGIVNTIAGGGTFLTFPALVASGVPPVVANATSTVAVFPGYLGGTVGYRREILALERGRVIRVTGWTLLGGLAGSGLLLVSSDAAFSAVVPFLLLAATLAFAFGDRLTRWASRRRVAAFGGVGAFLVAVYGGYFNGGLGIVLLALFSLWGMRDVHAMNGLKTWLSFALSAISVAIFALAGIVAWPQALGMAAASTVGGYAGAPLARALPRGLVRAVIIGIGGSMSVVFLARLFA